MMQDEKTKKRIYKMSFAGVYPLYVAKAEKKARTKAEVDEVIRWLTGYSQKQMAAQLEKQADDDVRQRPVRHGHGEARGKGSERSESDVPLLLVRPRAGRERDGPGTLGFRHEKRAATLARSRFRSTGRGASAAAGTPRPEDMTVAGV